MKKILLTCTILMGVFATAQISKGTVYLSGQVSYEHQKNNNINSKRNEFLVMPNAGFFVASNLAIGTGIGYVNNKYEMDHSINNEIGTYRFMNTNELSVIRIAPFVRKYWNLSENLYFFGQLEVPIDFGTSEFDSTSTLNTYYGFFAAENNKGKEKFTTIGVNVKPGLDYFLNKNWSIEATLGEFGYNNYKVKDADNGTNMYRFGLNLANVGLGVKYVFAK